MCEEVSCPFCQEPDFDKIGLKYHLSNGYCDVYEETENLPSPIFSKDMK